MLNVRLNKQLEEKLKNYSQRKNLSKTDVVKEALVLYFSKEPAIRSPFELGDDLFGKVGSGHSDASTQYKTTIRDKIREKHSH